MLKQSNFEKISNVWQVGLIHYGFTSMAGCLRENEISDQTSWDFSV
jgi:hypothetical protein